MTETHHAKRADAPKINLLAIRTEAGLSLSQAAELTGVSKAMLGQIERGTSSPTLVTLWKLAKGFHLPLSAFIDAPAADPAPDSAPAAPFRRVTFDDSISIDRLLPFDPHFGSETFLVTLTPGQTHVSHAHDRGVVEDIIVISGVVELEISGRWARYEAAQAVRFKADQPHSYRNPGGTPAQFHNTIHYPKPET